MTTRVKEENYVQIQGWMVSQLGLKGNELLVYAIIFGFSQTDGQVFSGSLQYLADWANSSKQGIQKCLKKLLEKNLIGKDEEYINGVKFVSYYATKLHGVCNKVAWGMQQSCTNNKEYNNRYNKESNDQNDVKPQKEGEEDQHIINFRNAIENEFNELWAAYPKKQGRQTALRAYTRARRAGVDKDTVLDGINAYKRFIMANNVDSRYIKQGSTWFNQECWHDDYSLKQPPTKQSQERGRYEMPESAAWIKELG